MADKMQLEAQARDRVGKGAARAMRKVGKIPAVIYGDKKEALPISVNFNTILKHLHTGQFLTTIYHINVNNEEIMVIPKDIQLDVVKDLPMHVDFLRIAKGAKVEVDVMVTFLNEETCKGLKAGGVLNIVRHSIELSCDPSSIPEAIEVDLEGVDMGDAVHISDITIPAGAKLVEDDRDFTIATIAAPVEEVVEEEVVEVSTETEDGEGEEEEGSE